jgi:hypothetical protein
VTANYRSDVHRCLDERSRLALRQARPVAVPLIVRAEWTLVGGPGSVRPRVMVQQCSNVLGDDRYTAPVELVVSVRTVIVWSVWHGAIGVRMIWDPCCDFSLITL